MRVVIVTGMSGAGKSSALNVFEDMDYYCIDNLPPQLMVNFLELAANSKQITKAAIGVDIRGRQFFESLMATIRNLRAMDAQVSMLFLEASDEVIIRRYKELRRPHPLDKAGNIYDGIQRERGLLQEIRSYSDRVVDTSNLTLGQLKEVISSYYLESPREKEILVAVTSFGYKYGILLDADLVFDARFIPNPYYEQELRPLTGLDAPVEDFIFRYEESEEFLQRIEDFLIFTLPYYQREGKSALSVGIGCTGGRHRSVCMAQALAQRLHDKGYVTVLNHRDKTHW